jgi:hypothetical protein
VPTEKAEKYIVRVSMKAGPFAIEPNSESTILASDLQPR